MTKSNFLNELLFRKIVLRTSLLISFSCHELDLKFAARFNDDKLRQKKQNEVYE
jgi:hypothetical protein